MSFLTPLFLLGLGAIAVPIIIHLIQKERKNVVAFPSLMFVRRIPYESVNRRKIRNWPLLLLRLAALALIVLAFARPFLRTDALSAAAAGAAREVIILLDRSYSLGYGDRWTKAVAAAQSTIDGLGPSDRATLVLFDSGAEVALRSTSDKGRLQAALAAAKPGASSTKFGPALKLAGSVLSESALPNREVVFISDFQRAGWLGAEGVRLPDGAKVTPISVAEGPVSNVSVTPAAIQRTLFNGQERVTITGGAQNRGAEAKDVSLTLEIDGRVVQTKPLRLDAFSSGTASFEPFIPTTPFTRGAVRVNDDALARDNSYYFVVSPRQRVKVVIVERPGSNRAASLYLAQALSLGENPSFEVVQKSMDAVAADDITSAAVVILNDVPVTQLMAERLGQFVQRGGGLFTALGERASWPTSSVDLLPLNPDAAADRTKGTPGRIGSVDYGHAVFESFRAPRSGDFSVARFYHYRTGKPVSGAQILARFDDGAPALLERKVGLGRVVAWTSSLDVTWNDLALKPVFLPFIHRVAANLASYTQRRPAMTVDEVLPAFAQGSTKTDMLVLTPSGARLPLDPKTGVVELREQGYYELRAGERDPQPMTVAANVDLRESDMTGIDPAEVVAGATGRASGAAPAETSGTITSEERERTQRIWWYLLFGGLLLLAAETLVANGIRTRYVR